MAGLKQLIQEVHRRSLWQVLAIYVVVSWVVFQVVQTVTEGLGLPQWFPAFAGRPDLGGTTSGHSIRGLLRHLGP